MQSFSFVLVSTNISQLSDLQNLADIEMQSLCERWYKKLVRERESSSRPPREEGPSLARAAIAEFIGTFVLVVRTLSCII